MSFARDRRERYEPDPRRRKLDIPTSAEASPPPKVIPSTDPSGSADVDESP